MAKAKAKVKKNKFSWRGAAKALLERQKQNQEAADKLIKKKKKKK